MKKAITDIFNGYVKVWHEKMTGFYVLLTVFQSYHDDGRMIMKGCVHWNSV